MIKNLKRFLTSEKGATAVEYGLLAALIATVIIVAVTAAGTSLKGIFTSLSASI